MRTRDLVRLFRNGLLLGRTAEIKPTSDYGQEGVEGGVILAASPEGALLLAIHGRADDRLWVGPESVKDVNDEGWWDLDLRLLRGESRKQLFYEIDAASDLDVMPELTEEFNK
jgi:hypothetical protein